MKTRTYSPHQHLFVCSSLLVLLALLLVACGGASTSQGGVTQTPGKTATLQTSCPAEGTARAAVMTPLALGKQDTLVYSEIRGNPLSPTSVTLKRYNVSTRTATEIVTLQNTNIYEAQISADGQWVLLHTMISDRPAIQLVRMDGQALQTLYCSPTLPGFGWMQWSPDQKYVAFQESGPPPGENGTPPPDPSQVPFKLLNTTTGAIQTKTRDSNQMLGAPQAWLDPTHLLVIRTASPGEIQKLSLLDIATWTIKPILDLPSSQCIDATHSLDGTQLFTSLAGECHQVGSAGSNNGPSSIQVQALSGGPAKTIYSTQTYAITALRAATNTSLLLLIKTDWEPSHNGLWKMNTDGTGLTKLLSEAAFIKDSAHEALGFTGQFGWTMDQPWANASHDGAYYSLAVTFYDYSGTVTGSNRLLVGSMTGVPPVTIASSPGASLTGWTTT